MGGDGRPGHKYNMKEETKIKRMVLKYVYTFKNKISLMLRTDRVLVYKANTLGQDACGAPCRLGRLITLEGYA